MALFDEFSDLQQQISGKKNVQMSRTSYLVKAGDVDVLPRLTATWFSLCAEEVLLQWHRSKALVKVEHALI